MLTVGSTCSRTLVCQSYMEHASMCGQYATDLQLSAAFCSDFRCLFLTAWSHCCLSERRLLCYTVRKQENYCRIWSDWEPLPIAKTFLAVSWDTAVCRRCAWNAVPSQEPALWSLRAAVGKANRQLGSVPWAVQGQVVELFLNYEIVKDLKQESQVLQVGTVCPKKQ